MVWFESSNPSVYYFCILPFFLRSIEKKAGEKKMSLVILLKWCQIELYYNKSPLKDEVHLKTRKQNLPAHGMTTRPRVQICLASVFKVRNTKVGESIVDVSLHGVMGVVPIRRDGKGPVIHQAGDHVWRESNDHGLCWEENKKGDINLGPSQLWLSSMPELHFHQFFYFF